MEPAPTCLPEAPELVATRVQHTAVTRVDDHEGSRIEKRVQPALAAPNDRRSARPDLEEQRRFVRDVRFLVREDDRADVPEHRRGSGLGKGSVVREGDDLRDEKNRDRSFESADVAK